MSLYRLENILHFYRDRPALSVDRWDIRQGAITGLYGPNGSGKSTLLKLLGFIDTPTLGAIYFQGRRAETYSGGIRDRVALMPQESHLLKRSVYKNIAYGLRIRKDRKKEAERIRQAMSLVGLDADQFADRPWYALSGGEARRVSMAARLVLNPSVLLLDEPTTSVDTASARMMKEAAAESHRKWGASLVISSHDLQWLQDICNDIVYMFNGTILGRGGKTFIFGPWEKTGTKRAARRLADGQVFEAENAPENTGSATAAIDPEALSIHTSAKEVPPGKTSLNGLITRLALEKHANRISASVSVGRNEFIIYLDSETISRHGYQPGMPVLIAYNPGNVEWYSAPAR